MRTLQPYLVKQADGLRKQGLGDRPAGSVGRRGLTMTRQVNKDHVTILGDSTQYRGPRLAPVPDTVQKHQRWSCSQPFVGQTHLLLPPPRLPRVSFYARSGQG